MPLTDRAVAGVVVAGVRAAAAALVEDDVPPGVAVVRDDRFGLGEDTALDNDSKRLDMVSYLMGGLWGTRVNDGILAMAAVARFWLWVRPFSSPTPKTRHRNICTRLSILHHLL